MLVKADYENKERICKLEKENQLALIEGICNNYFRDISIDYFKNDDWVVLEPEINEVKHLPDQQDHLNKYCGLNCVAY